MTTPKVGKFRRITELSFLTDNTCDIGASGKGARNVYITGNLSVGGTAAITGAQTFTAAATFADDLVIATTAKGIRADTSDTADNQGVYFCGGGAHAVTRGALIQLFGNETTTDGAKLVLSAGNSAAIDGRVLIVAPAAAPIQLYTTNLLRWYIDAAGPLTQDATNGGDIILTKGSTSVRQTAVNTITAAGTGTGDATALTGVINNVTTVAASTGVRLWNAGVGTVVHVRNGGANALTVYPNTGGTINAGSTDAAVSVATGAICTLACVAASTWIASEAPAA